jgi:hypothetical protein
MAERLQEFLLPRDGDRFAEYVCNTVPLHRLHEIWPQAANEDTLPGRLLIWDGKPLCRIVNEAGIRDLQELASDAIDREARKRLS